MQKEILLARQKKEQERESPLFNILNFHPKCITDRKSQVDNTDERYIRIIKDLQRQKDQVNNIKKHPHSYSH